jgi:hypothetical protein
VGLIEWLFVSLEVPLCNVGGRGSLLFTKRSEKLKTHPGQGKVILSGKREWPISTGTRL